MKRNIRVICALLLVLLLTACGNASPTETSGNAGTVDKSGTETVSKSGMGIREEAESVAAAFDETDVENNGGAYVRVGGKVYFRKYGPDALDKLATFGEFTESWHATGGASEIAAYDLTTRRTETAFTDTGYGNLYVGDGGFYLQERINQKDYVVWYSPDGAESRTIGEGTLLGVSDGGLLAVQESAGNGNAFFLYRNGTEAGYFISESSLLYAGLSDDGLFLISMEYEGEPDVGGDLTRTLWQLATDTEGELLCLGTLPDADFMFSTEPGQFLVTENQIGVVVGYYAGTGHFLNGYTALTAIPGVENSLTALDVETPEGMDEGEGFLPRLTVNDAGEIVAVTDLPGDLRVGWEEGQNGDLQVYDGFQWVTLKESFFPGRADGSGYEKIAQEMEYLDGAAYVTLAAAYASPLEDIGWRDAYSLLDMIYVTIPASEGTERELAAVEYDTVLQGNVWFQDGAASLLWQQNTFDPEAWKSEADSAFLIPISPDAVWDDRDDILLNAVRAEASGEADYYGYELPDADGQFLCLRLNRDGEAVYLTQKSPDALLTIDVGVTEAELSDTVENVSLTRRPSDEDTPWYWSRLTALENGVTVLIERTPDAGTVTEELAAQDGMFVRGSTLFCRTLNAGESVGLYASLPWHPEIRVAVTKNGTYGAYVFGEDNYLHEEPVNGRYAQKILAGYPLDEYSAPIGEWLYRDPDSKAHTARLSFGVLDMQEDGVLTVSQEDTPYLLNWTMERLHAEEYETPDLLCLKAEAPETAEALNGMQGNVGDYYLERFRTDGETILHLSQANNGNAALETLIPHQEQWLTEIVLHRYEGVAETVAPLRNIVLTAEVVKADAAQNAIWLQSAEARYEWDDMTPVYRAAPYAPCVCCPLSTPELFRAFETCRDPEYPMTAFQVTIERDGYVTALDAPAP